MLQWTSASERRFTRLGALNEARVLVANPYYAARRAVRAVLEPLGCTVIEAGVDREALRARIAHALRERTGIGIAVELLAPGEVPRSEGKAVRVVDRRPR